MIFAVKRFVSIKAAARAMGCKVVHTNIVVLMFQILTVALKFRKPTEILAYLAYQPIKEPT